jgi:hypothetical protein
MKGDTAKTSVALNFFNNAKVSITAKHPEVIAMRLQATCSPTPTLLTPFKKHHSHYRYSGSNFRVKIATLVTVIYKAIFEYPIRQCLSHF